MTDMSEPPARPVGLRERKKARTRAAIREHALRLFREQGYYATTIEQIADAAEVSPATFFRYFPTKEDVVLQDDIDVISLAALPALPPGLGPIAAIRAAMAEARTSLSEDDLARLRESMELAMQIPEVRARVVDEFVRTINLIAEAVALLAGRGAADFEVRAMSGAIMGVLMSVMVPETSDTLTAEGMSDVRELFARFDRALDYLERGMPL
jgi:AcrR family transcriptional regulator